MVPNLIKLNFLISTFHIDQLQFEVIDQSIKTFLYTLFRTLATTRYFANMEVFADPISKPKRIFAIIVFHRSRDSIAMRLSQVSTGEKNGKVFTVSAKTRLPWL